MNRRAMLKLAGGAGVGTVALGMGPCSGPKLSFWISTVIGTLDELKPLLPAQSDLLNKGIAVAKVFDEAYRAGKFADAETALENLHDVIRDVIAAAGVGASDKVRIALALLGVGLRTIAVILKERMEDPVVAAAVRQRAQTVEGARRLRLIDALANPKAVNAVFEASRP